MYDRGLSVLEQYGLEANPHTAEEVHSSDDTQAGLVKSVNITARPESLVIRLSFWRL